MTTLGDVYDPEVIGRGEGYLGRVKTCIKVGDYLHAEVQGRDGYKTKIHLSTLEGECSCPYGHNCKHAVAAFLYFKENKDMTDADTFIRSLKKMEKADLIKMIIDNLPHTSHLVMKHQFGKKTRSDSFVEDFISDFSYAKLQRLEAIGDTLSFKQIGRILGFIAKNEDDIYEKIYEDYGVADEGEVLADVVDALVDKMIQKITSEKELLTALPVGDVRDMIIHDAERFVKFKAVLKDHLPKEQYASFLLRLKSPDIGEIKQYLGFIDHQEWLSLPMYNLPLAERLGKTLDDKRLRFVTAVKKRDIKSVLAHFEVFESYHELKYAVDPGDLVLLLKQGKVKDEAYARKLFKKDFLWRYNQEHVAYLAHLITDYAMFAKEFDINGDFSKHGILLERMVELDKKRAQKHFEDPALLGSKHWTTIMELLALAEKTYGREFMLGLIRKNEEVFRTSSALKSALKKKGIVVRVLKGEYLVENG